MKKRDIEIYLNELGKNLKKEFGKANYKILNVYTIGEEFLICMKLVAFRTDKHDLDDIMGIIYNSSNEITYDKINNAMVKLYGSWDRVSDDAKRFIESVFLEYDETAAAKD